MNAAGQRGQPPRSAPLCERPPPSNGALVGRRGFGGDHSHGIKQYRTNCAAERVMNGGGEGMVNSGRERHAFLNKQNGAEGRS